MANFTLSPYSHPTTIVLIDDNESFLRSLELELPTDLACHCFTQPEEALEFLNTPPKLSPLVDRCFTVDTAEDEHVIHLDLGMIEQEINQPARFERISVVVVDYAMPILNGLDLCQQLTDPYIMKAMLTGVADEKVAVEAFNARILDHFMPKHTDNAVAAILNAINDLKQQYFTQHAARLRNTLAINPPAFLIDVEVAKFFHALLEERDLIEYYLVSDPYGFLMLDADGRLKRLVIQNADDMAAQLRFAKAHGAPQRVQDAISNKKQLGFFYDSPIDSGSQYNSGEDYHWDEYMTDVMQLQGTETWYLGLVDDPPSDIDFDPSKACYRNYLRNLT